MKDKKNMTLKQFMKNARRTLKNWDYYYQIAVEKELSGRKKSNSGSTENNT